MSYPLSQIARRFWANESGVRQEMQAPFLLWEAATSADEGLWMGTQTGASAPDCPRGGEPLVFQVMKGANLANAFGMGITVGSTDNNDIVLPDHSVSRFHAFFQQDPKDGVWKLTDAQSKNGSFIDGQRLEPQKPVSVPSGARLRFGDVEVLFEHADAFFSSLQK